MQVATCIEIAVLLALEVNPRVSFHAGDFSIPTVGVTADASSHRLIQSCHSAEAIILRNRFHDIMSDFHLEVGAKLAIPGSCMQVPYGH